MHGGMYAVIIYISIVHSSHTAHDNNQYARLCAHSIVLLSSLPLSSRRALLTTSRRLSDSEVTWHSHVSRSQSPELAQPNEFSNLLACAL